VVRGGSDGRAIDCEFSDLVGKGERDPGGGGEGEEVAAFVEGGGGEEGLRRRGGARWWRDVTQGIGYRLQRASIRVSGGSKRV